MKLKNILAFSVAFLSLFAVSCKKEDENIEYKYFTGELSVKFPQYVEAGYTKSFLADTMSTVKREDGQPFGFYFKESVKNVSDTVRYDGNTFTRTYTYTVPDTLGRFVLYLNAFSDGYYSSSANATFVIVKKGLGEGSSLSGFSIESTDKTMTDPRDGKSYYISEIGDCVWMRQNLAWEGAGRPLESCKPMTDIFGQYYTWEEAQNACPEGWRLPGESDWKNLATSMGVKAETGASINGLASRLTESISFNGVILWPYSKDLVPDNKARLSVMPVGYATYNGKDFTYAGLRRYAVIWSAEEDGEDAVCRYINSDRDILYYGLQSKSDFAASVRCVKNK